jgi:hypothetical protein
MGPAGIADPGYSLTYTLLNPEQWLKNVGHTSSWTGESTPSMVSK